MSFKDSIQVYKYDQNATLPTRNLPTDAGLDLYALEDTHLPMGETTKVRTGIAMNIPRGYVGKIEDRSSMAARGLTITGGVIDHGYNNEIVVIVNNLTCGPAYKIKAGDKIAQIVLHEILTVPVHEVKFLWDSERGGNGLGSSGR